jgi:hypothetical protein
VPLLLMLHVQNTDGDAAPAVAAPAVAPSATSLDDYSDDSITALYFVLESFNDMENFIKRLEESWRVLMHGGVLFLSFPKNDVKDEVVRSLLLRSKFCSVERLERFGPFDVHVRRNERNVYQRWECRACEKKTPKINVAIQYSERKFCFL